MSTYSHHAASTQYVFEIPEADPPVNTTDFAQNLTPSGSTSGSSVTETFLPSPAAPMSTPIQTLALAHGLKFFCGAMLLFSIASVALKFYGGAVGILAYAIGLFAFWKVHRMASFIFMVVSFLDIGAMFAYAYIEQLYDSTNLLVLLFLIVLLKFYALYNAYIFWSSSGKEDEFKLPETISTSVALDK